VPIVTLKLGALAEALELNPRQREDVDEVFARLRSQFSDRVEPGAPLLAILEAVAADPFDAASAEAALATGPGPLGAREKELLDGVEHVHNILTPEQRDKLRAALTPDVAKV
jgi:hypothetical protein